MSQPDRVTPEDIRMVQYFINEKGDITRWTSWIERKTIIAAQFPELIAAIDELTIAERTLQAVITQAVLEVEDKELPT